MQIGVAWITYVCAEPESMFSLAFHNLRLFPIIRATPIRISTVNNHLLSPLFVNKQLT